MQAFKKIIWSTLSFLIVLIIVSSAVLLPWENSESGSYMDSKLRESLAGKVDFIVVGASHGLAAFVPEIIDEELECFSYNLCGTMMPIYNRTYMLNKELARNPVKTVVLEMSYNALSRTSKREYGEGESLTLLRLDSFSERLSYMVKNVAFDDWLNVYCRHMISALSYWKSVLHHSAITRVDYSAKGYRAKESMDQTLSDDMIIDAYNSSKAIGEFTQENMDQFYELIHICKEQNCKIYVVSTPISNAAIWRSDDWDEFYRAMSEICAQQDIPWFDFNLLKDRYTQFLDASSFNDYAHLSAEGAEHFTYAFTDVINRYRTGEDVSSLFYSSYAEMKNDSPYMELSNPRINLLGVPEMNDLPMRDAPGDRFLQGLSPGRRSGRARQRFPDPAGSRARS